MNFSNKRKTYPHDHLGYQEITYVDLVAKMKFDMNRLEKTKKKLLRQLELEKSHRKYFIALEKLNRVEILIKQQENWYYD